MVMADMHHESSTPGSKFSDDWIDRFEQYAVSKTYPRGTLIFSQGDDSDGMFIIREGKIKVFMSDESGKEMLIAILGPGEIVGEVASLDGQPRTASVSAQAAWWSEVMDSAARALAPPRRSTAPSGRGSPHSSGRRAR